MARQDADKKLGFLARKVHVAQQIRSQPSSVVTLLRGWMLGLWQAKGAGFYGLGFAVTFVVFEIRSFVDDLVSSNVASGLAKQGMEFLFRFGVDSIVNGIMALLWPLQLINHFGAWGIVVLIGGYLLFERGLRPLVESWFPELGETRAFIEQKKRQKKEEKRIKKARRKDR